MKRLIALSMVLALVTLLLAGNRAKADDQPRPPLIQLLQGQESPPEAQPGEPEQPQPEQPQMDKEPPAPELPPQDGQQQ